MARIQSGHDFLRIARQTSAEATKGLLVATARRLHGEVMATDPRPQSFVRFVDGVEGAREEQAKPFGVIEYHYSRLEVVARVGLETLFGLSPVRRGDYRRNHRLYVNGREVRNLADWRPGDEILLGNPIAYSRVIELGKIKMRVPGTDHVYMQAARELRGRFGNLARIDFVWSGLSGGPQRYPSILIRER